LGTEDRNPRSMHLGEMDVPDVVALMDAEEREALAAVQRASGDIARAATHVAEVYLAGGRTFLLGAGTSGRLAVMEAAELPPTFGVEEGRFVPVTAGGTLSGPAAVTRHEDDEEAAALALDEAGCSAGDAVVGVAASGRTPFVVAGVDHARKRGAWVCGIANNARTPLLDAADVPVLLDTGPEVLTGSTRLKAGTAQKLALNRISTAAMVRAGRVVGNLMVEVRPVTAKLRRRCVRIVGELAGTSDEASTRLLEATGWNVRAAVERHRHEGHPDQGT
jgi:N-acetylmuramic acid 6-phosphate etherase